MANRHERWMSIRLCLPSVASCSQSNTRIPPPKNTCKTYFTQPRWKSASREWIVHWSLKTVLESLQFTFFPLCGGCLFSPVFFFLMFPFCPHHLLPLWQQNLHHPCFHSNRLPWKLGDSAAHPILLSLCKKCSVRESLFCPSLVYRKWVEAADLIWTFKHSQRNDLL